MDYTPPNYHSLAKMAIVHYVITGIFFGMYLLFGLVSNSGWFLIVYVILSYIVFSKFYFDGSDFVGEVKDFKKDYLRVWITPLIAILLIMGSQWILMSSNAISTDLSSGDYTFLVKVVPERAINLDNFHIDYNFKKNSGEVVFDIKELKSIDRLERLEVRVPKNVEIIDYDFSVEGRFLEEGIDFIRFNSSKESSDNFVVIVPNNISFDEVKFKGRLKGAGGFSPNGVFRFITESNLAAELNCNPISLNLGDYDCKGLICIPEKRNIELSEELSQEGDQLIIKYPKEYCDNENKPVGRYQQVIRLNTYLPEVEKGRDRLRDTSIALMISAMMAMVETGVSLFFILPYYRKKDRFKQN